MFEYWLFIAISNAFLLSKYKFYINFTAEAMNLANALPLEIGVLRVIS